MNSTFERKNRYGSIAAFVNTTRSSQDFQDVNQDDKTEPMGSDYDMVISKPK